jgi:hypothetical protein
MARILKGNIVLASSAVYGRKTPSSADFRTVTDMCGFAHLPASSPQERQRDKAWTASIGSRDLQMVAYDDGICSKARFGIG